MLATPVVVVVVTDWLSYLAHLRDVAVLRGLRHCGGVVRKDVGRDRRIDREGDVQIDERHLGAVRELDDRLAIELFRKHVTCHSATSSLFDYGDEGRLSKPPSSLRGAATS